MSIRVQQLASELDRDLAAINKAQTEENNGKLIYIHKGELAFDSYEALFTVTELTSE